MDLRSKSCAIYWKYLLNSDTVSITFLNDILSLMVADLRGRILSFVSFSRGIRGGGGGGGHWAMAPSLDAEGALCDCSAPSNLECVYKKRVVGGRHQAPSNDEKSLRKVPSCVYKENLVGGEGAPDRAPSNGDMSIRKCLFLP